jgi:hypothetical protein
LRAEGVNVVRSACGTGAGVRLAVIDNDGRSLDKVDLDAEVLVGVECVPRASAHAALLIGWAVGASTVGGGRFRGVAPDASVRFYCIPKAADEILSLPLAIVRAVDDGADVVVCATYVEGLTSPLLDDALEFARHVGRGGKGAAIVFPTGREMSSAGGSVHSSLSLGMGDPASDPRVFCVAPSARSGAWFLWRDRRGKLRPFANRGPALRWLAPGDDMADPFESSDRPWHAESSGASGIAAGVLSLVLACNSDLTVRELEGFLRCTVVAVDGSRQASEGGLADRRDLLPLGVDRDGHNAKHGYGRLDAAAACLACRDPFAFVLIQMGEAEAALAFVRRISSAATGRPYSERLAQWAARVVVWDPTLLHALSSIARSCRLRIAGNESRAVEPPGYLLRQMGIVLRLLLDKAPPLPLAAELDELDRWIAQGSSLHSPATGDAAILKFTEEVFREVSGTSTTREGPLSGPRVAGPHPPPANEVSARKASGSGSA